MIAMPSAIRGLAKRSSVNPKPVVASPPDASAPGGGPRPARRSQAKAGQPCRSYAKQGEGELNTEWVGRLEVFFSSHLQAFTGIYSHLQTPSPPGGVGRSETEVGRWPRRSRQGVPSPAKPSQAFSRKKKIVYFFMGTPNHPKSTSPPRGWGAPCAHFSIQSISKVFKDIQSYSRHF
jgi:hypothetical protein